MNLFTDLLITYSRFGSQSYNKNTVSPPDLLICVNGALYAGLDAYFFKNLSGIDKFVNPNHRTLSILKK